MVMPTKTEEKRHRYFELLTNFTLHIKVSTTTVRQTRATSAGFRARQRLLRQLGVRKRNRMQMPRKQQLHN